MNKQRYFFVGSEWLYYKLYMGSQTSDIFLTQVLKPVADELLEQKVIDKWFFINYKDPDRHIRIRFRVLNPENLNYVIKILHRVITPFVEDKTINKVLIDTYKRELERYGTETIEESESVFFSNSKLITYIISESGDDQNRWLWGLKSIDIFLDAWNLSLIQKRELFKSLKMAFDEEMGATTPINQQLSKRFRANRAAINQILEKNSNVGYDIVLDQYLVENKPIASKIIKKLEGQNAPIPVQSLLKSYIHMHCNRLFKSKQRLNEWVLYNFLFQYYRSKVAQIESNKQKVLIK